MDDEDTYAVVAGWINEDGSVTARGFGFDEEPDVGQTFTGMMTLSSSKTTIDLEEPDIVYATEVPDTDAIDGMVAGLESAARPRVSGEAEPEREEWSDGSARAVIGPCQPVDKRLAAIEERLVAAESQAQAARGDTKDESTPVTLQARVRRVEGALGIESPSAHDPDGARFYLGGTTVKGELERLDDRLSDLKEYVARSHGQDDQEPHDAA